MDVLTKKVKEEPLLFTFLGLTVAALGGGLRSLATGDNRSSQTMMRARVFFQLCTVCTLVGTVYWKAYTGDTSAWALVLPAAAAAAAACAPPPPSPVPPLPLTHSPLPSTLPTPCQSWAGAAPRAQSCPRTSPTCGHQTRWRCGRATAGAALPPRSGSSGSGCIFSACNGSGCG